MPQIYPHTLQKSQKYVCVYRHCEGGCQRKKRERSQDEGEALWQRVHESQAVSRRVRHAP